MPPINSIIDKKMHIETKKIINFKNLFVLIFLKIKSKKIIIMIAPIPYTGAHGPYKIPDPPSHLNNV